MKKTLLVLTVAALLMMGTSAAWGAFGSVTINDLTESLVVTTALSSDNQYLNLTINDFTGEAVTITGTWNASDSHTLLKAGTGYAIFWSPDDPLDTAKWPDATNGPLVHISDFAVVTIGAGTNLQSIDIRFESDGASTFQSDLRASIPPTAAIQLITENGQFQDLTNLGGLDYGTVFTLSAAVRYSPRAPASQRPPLWDRADRTAWPEAEIQEELITNSFIVANQGRVSRGPAFLFQNENATSLAIITK